MRVMKIAKVSATGNSLDDAKQSKKSPDRQNTGGFFDRFVRTFGRGRGLTALLKDTGGMPKDSSHASNLTPWTPESRRKDGSLEQLERRLAEETSKNLELEAMIKQKNKVIEETHAEIRKIKTQKDKSMFWRGLLVDYRHNLEKFHILGILKAFGWKTELEGWKDLVEKDGSFDRKMYLANNPDVARASIDPVIHFIVFGAEENRNPNRYFDTRWYLSKNKDVEQAGVNPLIHYILYGANELRDTSPRFSTKRYLQKCPDAATSKISPLAHYLKFGLKRGISAAATDLDIVDLSTIKLVPAESFAEPKEPVTIIVPVYNGYEQTRRLLANLLPHTSPRHSIILINDASPDGRILPMLRTCEEKHENVTVRDNSRNLGFAKSVNVGILESRGHVVVLNSDVQVPPDWLPRMILPIEKDPGIASVTPHSNVSSLTGFPHLHCEQEIIWDLSLAEVDAGFRQLEGKVIDLPAGIGFCMAINRAALEAASLFDGETFRRGYYEDTDWSQRASSYGFRNVLASNLFVYHEPGSESFGVENRVKYSEENRKLFEQRWPDYEHKRRIYVHTDPARDQRRVAQMNILAKSANRRVAVLDHSWGGGSNIYSARLVENIAHSGDFVLWMNFSYENVELSGYRHGHGVTMIAQSATSWQFIEHLAIDEFIFNGIPGASRPFAVLEKLLEILDGDRTRRLNVLIHDYFLVCPSINLLNAKEQYCGVPAAPECEKCFETLGVETYGAKSIAQWRSQWLHLLRRADSIRCFSESSRRIIEEAFPDQEFATFEVTPHKRGARLPSVRVTDKQSLNIGVLGKMLRHKGSDVIVRLANFLQEQDSDVGLTVFGTWEDVPPPSNVRVTGKYDVDDLPRLIAEDGANVFLFPSICPETFSFVLSELFDMKLPVAAFDLGAQGERVAAYERGILIGSQEPQAILDVLQELFARSYKR